MTAGSASASGGVRGLDFRRLRVRAGPGVRGPGDGDTFHVDEG